MAVKDFEVRLEDWRVCFRRFLNKNLEKLNYNGEVISFKEWIIRECFGNCTSEFEEQTVVENLKEEFANYLESL